MNLSMEVVPANYFIDRFLMLYGVYEVSGTRLLQTVLRPGMTVLDVGANSGYYSLLAARLVTPDGCVHAFEPVPALRAKFQRNLEQNGLQNVFVHPLVVAADPGEMDVYVSACANNDGLASVMAGAGRSEHALRVQSVSIDHFLEKFGGREPDFVKIDVEGAEDLVLKGARETLTSGAPAVLFESYDVDRLATVLGDWGYEVRHLHYSLKNGLEFPRLGEKFENTFYYEGKNFVALKPGSPFGSFEAIAARSLRRVPWGLRLLGRLA
jgi:FkbM family methyltransferase